MKTGLQQFNEWFSRPSNFTYSEDEIKDKINEFLEQEPPATPSTRTAEQEALKQIEQMSDCGSPELTIVRMKAIATGAISKPSSARTAEEIFIEQSKSDYMSSEGFSSTSFGLDGIPHCRRGAIYAIMEKFAAQNHPLPHPDSKIVVFNDGTYTAALDGNVYDLEHKEGWLTTIPVGVAFGLGHRKK